MKADYVTKSQFKIFKSEFKRFETKTDVKFKSIDLKFEAIDKRFDEVDKRFNEVDKRFDAIDKRFDEMHVFIRDCMEEQRIYYREECDRYVGSLYERFSSQVQAIFEHPIFSTYKPQN